IHSALQNLLTDDFNLTFARDAAAAFAALADAPFDLVLLSVELRGVAVSDLLCDLRCHPASADLPIILLAPVEDSEPALQGLQSGANDYMTKPLNAGVVW